MSVPLPPSRVSAVELTSAVGVLSATNTSFAEVPVSVSTPVVRDIVLPVTAEVAIPVAVVVAVE
jgi:hypothetical protein